MTTRRSIISAGAGAAGALVLGKRPLVLPESIHGRAFAKEHGLVSVPTIGQRQDDVAAEKQLNRKPPLVGGDFGSFTAQQELMTALEAQDVVSDGTLRGIPETDIKAYEDAAFFANVLAVNPSTADTTGPYYDAYSTGFGVENGVWRFHCISEASFTNSGGGQNAVRLTYDLNGGAQVVMDFNTPTTSTSRERYAMAGTIGGISAPDVITFHFQYHPITAATTATARAPWMMVFFERTG